MRIPALVFTAFITPLAAFAEDAPKTEALGVYHEVIAPIFESKCVSCHGEDKVKGKLRMDSFEALMKGGTSGESISPGDEDSELIYRIITDDEDDHMPPAKKPQLSAEEIEVIQWWVVSGAEEEKKVGELAPDAALVAKIQSVVAAVSAGVIAGDVSAKPAVDRAALAANAEKAAAVAQAVSETLGAPVLAIASGSDKVHFSAVNLRDTFGDSEIEKLVPLGESLVDLNLARTQVTDAGLATLGKMVSLKRLRLENTKVGDEGLKHLVNLGDLEYLNLYGTGVTNDGIASLSKLKGLKKLFVWETGVTREAAEKLAEEVPGLSINLGWDNEVPGASPAPASTDKQPETEKSS